jgi:hypothetical protein
MKNFAPKRGFSSGGGGFQGILERFLSMLPQGNIGFAIVALNTLFYAAYCFWPVTKMYSFMNNFTFSNYNLRNGKLHTMFTCHFAHMSFFTYLLDSVITFLFC